MKVVYQAFEDANNFIKCFKSREDFKTCHIHSRIEIYYALEDGVTVLLNGETVDLKKDTFVVADSFDSHANWGSGERYSLFIPERYFDTYKEAKGGATIKEHYFTDPACTGKVKRTLDELYELQEKGELTALEAEGLVKYLLGTVLSYTELIYKDEGKGSDTLKEVLVFINEHYRGDVSLDAIAGALGFNRHYLSHIIGRAVGEPLNDYVNGLRLDYFSTHVSRAKSVQVAARESGFTSLATFYRAFQKAYGCSPKEYFSVKKR